MCACFSNSLHCTAILTPNTTIAPKIAAYTRMRTAIVPPPGQGSTVIDVSNEGSLSRLHSIFWTSRRQKNGKKDSELCGTRSVIRKNATYFAGGCFFSIFAQVSRRVVVRLNTGLPGEESGSAQKYPNRSN